MNQTTLDFDAAAAARDTAIQQVTEHAGEVWLDEAKRWMYGFLCANKVYLPDAAWVHGCPDPPNDRRAFGAVIRWAVKNGWMVRDGEHPRRSGHLTPGPKYRSCIYRGEL